MTTAPSLLQLTEEATPMLELLTRAGCGSIKILDETGTSLYEIDEGENSSTAIAARAIRIEAEPVGLIEVKSRHGDELAELVSRLLDGVYKRKLVSHMYQETLSDSYEELLARNQELETLTQSLETQVEERTRELDETHAHLAREEKIGAIGRLAAGVAHELNTPLACVRSNLDTLRDPEVRENNTELEEILGESIEMVDRAAGIVRNLRSLSHVDDVGLTEVDLNQELEVIISRLEVPAAVEITRELQPLPRMKVDGKQLNVAVLHVLENACDAVKQGGQVRIVTNTDGEAVVLRIVDTGPGIPAENLHRVFDPFFTTKDVGSGTGLGLTVARDVVRAHGGDISIEPGRARGTAVRLNIPRVFERKTT